MKIHKITLSNEKPMQGNAWVELPLTISSRMGGL